MIDLEKERSLIESTALKNGFKLKQQHNGEMALNPYVFDFAEELLANKQAEIIELKQKLEKLESGDVVVVPREPTSKMISASFAYRDCNDGYEISDIYKAMIEVGEIK